MVKHTQTICRQQPTNCLSVFDHFVGLALKGLRKLIEEHDIRVTPRIGKIQEFNVQVMLGEHGQIVLTWSSSIKRIPVN